MPSLCALQEQLAAAQRDTMSKAQRLEGEINHLQSALASANATRESLHVQLHALQESASAENVAASRTAEAEARAAAFERQASTLRAQAAASQAALQDEVKALSVSALSVVFEPCATPGRMAISTPCVHVLFQVVQH